MLKRKDVTTKLTVLQRWRASKHKSGSVRKELAILIKELEQTGDHKDPVNVARQRINEKYGHDWRGRGAVVNDANQWSDNELPPFLHYK